MGDQPVTTPSCLTVFHYSIYDCQTSTGLRVALTVLDTFLDPLCRASLAFDTKIS